MSRARAEERLDIALSEFRIAIVQGLPRVGKTRLIARWCEAQPSAEIIRPAQVSTSSASVRVVDHFAEHDVTAFVDAFREMEKAGVDVRFVIAPVDLATARRLQETLTGSLSVVDLDPLQVDDALAIQFDMSDPIGPILDAPIEAQPVAAHSYDPDLHWLRGGLPESLNAQTDAASLRWRREMLAGLFLRDYSRWGVTPAMKLEDILAWVARQNGGEFDLGAPPVGKKNEALSSLFVLERLGLIRTLKCFPLNPSRMPKIYIRDSGILHAQLGIETSAQLRSHADVGESWETYAIETLVLTADRSCPAYFYREPAPGGPDEIDLLLDFRARNGRLVAVEFKTSADEKPRIGFHRGMAALNATDGFVVHSGSAAITDGHIHRLDLGSARARILELSAS